MFKMSRILALTTTILMLFFSCFAEASNKKIMETMTWFEIKDAMKTNPTVIIPLGTASKEHGPHLPMNTDLIMANYLRDRVVEKVDNIIVAPPITYSYYSTFVDYPGTISLSFQTSLGMILDTCHVLAKQGFKKFYILNTGFRTKDVLKVAKQILLAEGIQMDYFDDFEVRKDPALQNLIKQARGTHADEVETSMLLYMAPEVVDMKQAKKDDLPRLTLPGVGFTPNPNDKTKTYSPTGIWGDATLANKEKGKVFTEAAVQHLIEDIHRLQKS